jgi:hypothetical protein
MLFPLNDTLEMERVTTWQPFFLIAFHVRQADYAISMLLACVSFAPIERGLDVHPETEGDQCAPVNSLSEFLLLSLFCTTTTIETVVDYVVGMNL